MIQVVTTVEVRADCLKEFQLALNDIVPLVQAEEGCLAYEPMADLDIGLPTQIKPRNSTITLVESWETIDSLRAHLQAAHMARFRHTAQGYVLGIRHQVLQPLT